VLLPSCRGQRTRLYFLQFLLLTLAQRMCASDRELATCEESFQDCYHEGHVLAIHELDQRVVEHPVYNADR
jgi:hypothetical protein